MLFYAAKIRKKIGPTKYQPDFLSKIILFCLITQRANFRNLQIQDQFQEHQTKLDQSA